MRKLLSQHFSRRSIWILALFLFAAHISLGQSKLRFKKIAVTKEPIVLDSLSIVPSSLQIPGVKPSDYQIDAASARLSWLHQPDSDSVTIQYRVFPIYFSKQYQHKNPKIIDSLYAFTISPKAGGNIDSSAFVNTNTLDYNGSYGRSISVGNNQDAALSSNFNLQVNGYLPDSIKVEAAISDNTLPFQPEGNTQNLQQFDQVYIRLKKRQHSLQLGDYNIDRPEGYFLNFNKRVQGLYFQSGFKLSKKVSNSFALSGSVAKGEFARNIFDGTEGNQGPYKLTGNNGMQFFIVLAGSEKVFINGIIQERGENADYIINYNTAEIRFMPRRLITKDSRIQVEFEYQSRNYLNSLIYAWDELAIGNKLKFRLNIYSNQDAKNQGYNQTLDGNQKRFLSTIGDNIDQAYYPIVSADTFGAGKTLYKIIDSTVLGIHYDSVFIYSTNPDSAQYNISFSYLGPSKGDYIISSKVANGRVYDWVAPIGGVPQGDYAPVRLLITPKQQQVVTLHTSYQIDSFKNIQVEMAASNYRPNLFASGNVAKHIGIAGKIGYSEQRFFGKKDTTNRQAWHWKNEINYEYVDAQFKAIAPYRNVEFARDWNVPQDLYNTTTQNQKPTENLGSFHTQIGQQSLGNLDYGLSLYRRAGLYEGIRNELSYQKTQKNWNLNLGGNLLQSKDTAQISQYFRPQLQAEFRLPTWNHVALGLQLYREDNQLRNRKQDTLLPASFRFTTATVYLKQASNQPLNYSLSYSYRSDNRTRNNVFVLQSHSQTVDATFGLLNKKNQRINFMGAYRQLFIDDSSFTNQKAEETGLGRIEYSGSLFKGAIRLQTLYETGAGQEQKQSFTYVEVPTGQGQYYWVDYNNDGVQQPNEFQTALYPDQKKFIRVLTPTNDYVRVNYVQLNQSLYLDPSFFFAPNPKGLKRLISKFSDQAALQVNNRLSQVNGLQALNPVIASLGDDHIINAGTILSNTLFFNRNVARFGIEYTYTYNTNKQLLTYGVEGLENKVHLGKFRWNFNANLSTNINASTGLRQFSSALSDGRTYRVHSQNWAPSLSWMYRSVFRITGTLQFDKRENEPTFGGEQATIKRIDLECKLSQPKTGIIALRASFAGIDYTGLTSAPVAFTLLDALQPGSNFLWYANWERRIGKGIELSLEYEGRKPGNGTSIHTGRMTVRAIL